MTLAVSAECAHGECKGETAETEPVADEARRKHGAHVGDGGTPPVAPHHLDGRAVRCAHRERHRVVAVRQVQAADDHFMHLRGHGAIVSAPDTEMEIKPVYDLAWHPWAGLPVIIEMTAVDHKGQTATLPPLHMTLPERTFQNPTARKLITMRKRLIRTPEAAAENIARELFDIMVAPASYNGHSVVFLSLKTMSARLIYDPSIKSIREIIAQLWDTALQIEEGNLAMASRDMREAQRNLEKTLNDPNATQEDISRALDEFNQAMANYFQEIILNR